MRGPPGPKAPKGIKEFQGRRGLRERRETKARPDRKDNRARKEKQGKRVRRGKQGLQAHRDPKEIRAKPAHRARRAKQALQAHKAPRGREKQVRPGRKVLLVQREQPPQSAFTLSDRTPVTTTARSPAAQAKHWRLSPARVEAYPFRRKVRRKASRVVTVRDQHWHSVCGNEGSERCAARISAMDLNMMMVETGSSMGSVTKPNAPPAAPDAVAKTVCTSRDLPCGPTCMVRSATLRADWRALVVAVEMVCRTGVGRASPISSNGLPTMLARRAAKPGCSRD